MPTSISKTMLKTLHYTLPLSMGSLRLSSSCYRCVCVWDSIYGIFMLIANAFVVILVTITKQDKLQSECFLSLQYDSFL